LRLVDVLALGGIVVAAVLLVGIVGLFVAQMATRLVGASDIGIVWEYSGYLQAIIVLLGSAYTLRSGGHIRVSLIVGRIPADYVTPVEVVCSLIGLGVAFCVTVALSNEAITSFLIERRSYFPSETLLWIPQSGMALSAALLTLAFVARLLRLALGLPPEDNQDATVPSE
jgi:TRAP-type C4-dicarboxylate transport system permease small subunit